MLLSGCLLHVRQNIVLPFSDVDGSPQLDCYQKRHIPSGTGQVRQAMSWATRSSRAGTRTALGVRHRDEI